MLSPKSFVLDYVAGREANKHFEKGVSDHFYGYFKSAKSLGVNVVKPRKNAFGFFFEGDEIGSMRYMLSSFVTSDAVKVCSNKYYTKKFLKKAAVAIPASQVFPSSVGYDKALNYFCSRLKIRGQVVKPAGGKAGKGITVDVSETDFKEAWEYALANSGARDGGIIIEDYVEGIDLRVIVVNGKFACATTRAPAYVLGDGESSMQRLIEIKESERSLNPYHRSRPLACAKLEKFDPLYVPKVGEYVSLSAKANIHQGAEAIDVTELVPEVCKQNCIAAASAIPGLGVAGVDLIIKNFKDDPGFVIEINTSCNFAMHYCPMFGLARNPANMIVHDMLDVYSVRKGGLKF